MTFEMGKPSALKQAKATAITWDERGNVEIIALANQYRPARDAACLTRSNDVDYDDTSTKARQK